MKKIKRILFLILVSLSILLTTGCDLFSSLSTKTTTIDLPSTTESTNTTKSSETTKSTESTTKPTTESTESTTIHTHSFVLEVVSDEYLASEADCQNKATYYYSCSCSEHGTLTFEYGEYGNHKYSEYVSNSDATCLTNGTKSRYCLVCECEDQIEDVNSKLGHDYVKHERVEATLETSGNVEYYTCSRCEEIFIKENETYKSVSAETVIINALSHTCSVKENGHHERVEATCVQDGTVEYYECECSKKYSDINCTIELQNYVISKTGHTIVHHDAKAPTCLEAGHNAYDTCSECSYTTYSEISKLGHDIINHSGQAATCTEIGFEAYQTCSRCDYSTYAEISALEHDLVHHDAKEATCTEVGWYEYNTCSRCTYTTYTEIAKKNHSYKQEVATQEYLKTAATCEAAAVYYKSCTCGKKGTTTFTSGNPLGHSLVQVSEKAATTTSVGWNAYEYCTRCSYTTYVEIPIIDDGKTDYGTNYYNGYYSSILTWEDGEDLLEKLSAIINTNVTALKYEGNWLSNRAADQSLDDLEMYDVVYSAEYVPKTATSAQVNREHAFCASLMTGIGTSTAVSRYGRATDFQNLFASATSGNTSRGNKCYGYASKTASSYKNYTTSNGYDGYSYDEYNFEPGDIDKGRLARAIFYMACMYYNETFTYTYTIESTSAPSSSYYSSVVSKGNNKYEVTFTTKGLTIKGSYDTYIDETKCSSLSQSDYVEYTQGNLCEYAIGNLYDLYTWAMTYDVDRLEYQHSNSVYTYSTGNSYGGIQGNRNPFVDYPELIDYIWGSKKDEAGELKYLKPTYLDLEIGKNGVSNYAIKTAKREYSLNSTFSLSDLELCGIGYNFTVGSAPSSYTIKDSNGAIVTEGYKFTSEGTHTFTIITPINEIKYDIKVAYDPISTATYSHEFKVADLSTAVTSGSTKSVTLSKMGFSFYFAGGTTRQNNTTFGLQFGSSSSPVTNLTLTTTSSLSNITGIYFRGGTASKSQITLNMKVNGTTVKTFTLKYVDNVTPLTAYYELDTPVSGTITFEIVNSQSKAFYIQNIAFNYQK